MESRPERLRGSTGGRRGHRPRTLSTRRPWMVGVEDEGDRPPRQRCELRVDMRNARLPPARPTRGVQRVMGLPRDFNRLDRRLCAERPINWDPPSDRRHCCTPSPPHSLSPQPSPSPAPFSPHSVPFASVVMFPPPPGTLAPYPHPELTGNLIAHRILYPSHDAHNLRSQVSP